MSVSQLNSSGCKVEFENKIAKIYDTNGKLMGKGDQTRGNLLYLDMDNATCLVVEFDDVCLWHKRLCHVNLITWLVLVVWEETDVILSWRNLTI